MEILLQKHLKGVGNLLVHKSKIFSSGNPTIQQLTVKY